VTRLRRGVAAGLGVPLLAYAGWLYYASHYDPAIRNNTFVGGTESQLRERFGEPVTEGTGYRVLGYHVPLALPTGRIRTVVFYPRGWFPPEGGTLWVWLVEHDGEWICFESCWFGAGVTF